MIDTWSAGDVSWTFAEDGSLKIQQGEKEETAYWTITDNQEIDIAFSDRVVSYHVEQPQNDKLIFSTENETVTLNREQN